MKTPLFLVLVLTFLIGCKTKKDFTINTFNNRMQSSENYTIIYNMKCTLGDDVATAFTKEIAEDSNFCTTLVKTYMICPKTQDKNIGPLIELILERKDGKNILHRLYQLLLKYEENLIDINSLQYLQNVIEKIDSLDEKKIKYVS